MSYVIRDMEIGDESEFCHCLESWSAEMAESGDHKKRWLERMKSEGLGVKLAVANEGSYAGMIQYFPEKFSPAKTPSGNGWFIQCIWVHGHKKGQGNFQGRGIGTALLDAAIGDLRSREVPVVLAWGITLPFWMKSRWFRRKGFITADRNGSSELMMKSLDGAVHSATWRKTVKTPPRRSSGGKLKATTFMSGACTVTAITHERLIKAIGDLPVDLELIDSSQPDNLEEWGISDSIYIGERTIRMGPPPSTGKLSRIIRRELNRG